MSKEKQIEEMVRDLCDIECKGMKCNICDSHCCEYRMQAEVLYNAGYRKQSEGEGFMLTFDGTTEYFNKEVVIYAVKAYMRRNRWIPVTEALPEEGCASVVAVIYRDNPLQDWECVVTAAYFVPINGKIDGMWVLLDDEKKIESKEIHITHWVPLPEAPKGGAE